eukprot:jgi/Chrzof1/11286/Cz05g31040.t1_ZEP2[v5.2]
MALDANAPAAMPQELDVAIIGGGPGGMAAAACIHKARPDLSVAVFERANKLLPVGFSVLLAQNAFTALKAMDPAIHEKVKQLLLPDGDNTFYHKTGKVLRTSASINSAVKKYDVQEVGRIKWWQLQQCFLNFFPRDWLHLGAELQSMKDGPDNVNLTFIDGSTATAKVVIGCDGNLSAVRQHVLNDGLPVFANAAVWRGTLPVPPEWSYRSSMYTSWAEPEKGHMWLAISSDDDMLLWQAFAPWSADRQQELGSSRYIDHDATASKSDSKVQRCLSAFDESWPQHVRDAIAATPADMITEHGQFFRDVENCMTWGKGRVTLLGDAAHLATPILGPGTNMALEDALEIARAIAELGPSPQVLRKYEDIRIPRASRIQAASVRMARDLWLGGREADQFAWFEENKNWYLRHQHEPLPAGSSKVALES